MKSMFFKRLCAFLTDFIIVTVLFTVITMGFQTNSKLSEEASSLVSKYSKQEITIEEYNKRAREINYELQKENVTVNILSCTITIGYFFVFNYLNKGKTLGKTLFKIKVTEDGRSPSIKAIVLRGIFIYGVLSSLYNIIFVNIFDVKKFSVGYSIVSYIESIFVIVSGFMVLYRKDKRGLHDMIAKTMVVEEVK